MRERKPELNKLSSYAVVLLSVIALLCVLSGYTQPPQADEGTGAHIFQLAIVLLAPTILLFLATADWSRPLRSVRPLAFSVAVLVLAFGALYFLENVRDPHYYGQHAELAPEDGPAWHRRAGLNCRVYSARNIIAGSIRTA